MKKTKANHDHEKLARLLGDGVKVGKALIESGYSKKSAAIGWARVPNAVLGMLPKKAKKLMQLGRETSKEERKNLVFGRLIQNTAQGSDKGALSAKILGSAADTAMWQPDTQVGLIVLQTPPGMTEERIQEMLKPPEDL